ncbi:hypothetical protein [Apibacter sp. HY039]|uniref:hypothetical protein n=1 Tax=Apibacter sp. HY039 TaxID=2501476 RepID=UPI000FEBEDA1|nr:hypothetical protein [Apibacter sp. HY039]
MSEVVGLLDQLSANSQGKSELIDFFDQAGNDIVISINLDQGMGSGSAYRGVTLGIPQKVPVEGNHSP